MRRIDFRKLVSAENELLMMSERLRAVQTETEDIIRKINDMTGWKESKVSEEAARSEKDPAVSRLKRSGELQEISERLSAEAIALRKASESLNRVICVYKKAENDVSEIYSGEYQIIPRTRFGTSHFEKLADFDELIPVRTEDQVSGAFVVDNGSREGTQSNIIPTETELIRTISGDFLI